MAAKKKPAKRNEFEDSDDDLFEADNDADSEALPDVEGTRNGLPPGVRLRDWRDVERYREERELKRLIEADDLLFDD